MEREGQNGAQARGMLAGPVHAGAEPARRAHGGRRRRTRGARPGAARAKRFLAAAGTGMAAAALMAAPAQASGGIFEILHPEVEKGGIELEALNSYFAEDVPAGEERSVHEVALGIGVTSWWKTVGALEIGNPRGETAELEAFEWQNIFVLWRGAPGGDHSDDHGHDHGHSHAADGAAAGTLGLHATLEIPNAAGISKGALALGPIAEARWGSVVLLGNLSVEFPFEGGKDPGFSYALGAAVPVAPSWRLGVEAHGTVEEAFGDAPDFDDQAHYLGPVLAHAADLGRGRVLETRLAVLPGLTDRGSRDLALSLNAELKF